MPPINWDVVLPIIVTGVVSSGGAYVAALIRNRSPEVKANLEQIARDAAAKMIDQLQEQVDALKADLATERRERREERERLQGQITTLQQENVTLQGQVQALQLENDTLKSGNGNGKPRGGLGRR